jgi:hypothetical protein
VADNNLQDFKKKESKEVLEADHGEQGSNEQGFDIQIPPPLHR